MEGFENPSLAVAIVPQQQQQMRVQAQQQQRQTGVEGGGGQPAPAPSPTPAPAGYPQAGSAGGAPTPAPSPTPSPSPATPDLSSLLAGMGVSLPQGADAQAQAAHIAQQIRQGQENARLAQVAQQMQPQWGDFQKWQAQQRQAAQPKAPSYKEQVPEFNPAWAHQVMRDGQGNLVARPGCDPLIPMKLQAYADWRQGQEQQLFSDPAGFLFRPEVGVRQQVEQMVNQIVEQRTQLLREQMEADQIKQQIRPYLYTQDQFGNEVRTEVGNIYLQAIEQADAMGVRSVQGMHEFAMGKLAQAMMNRQQTQQQQQPAPAALPAPSPQEQVKNDFLQRMRGVQQGGPAVQPPPGNNVGGQPPAMGGLEGLKNTLRQRLKGVALPVNGNYVDE